MVREGAGLNTSLLKHYRNAGLNNTEIKNALEFMRSNGLDPRTNPWSLPRFARGDFIDSMVGNNMGHNYPHIDSFDWQTGFTQSTKSLDLTARSYANNATAFERRVDRYMNILDSWQGESRFWGNNPPIDPSQVGAKQLNLVVQQNQLQSWHRAILQRVQQNYPNVNLNLLERF